MLDRDALGEALLKIQVIANGALQSEDEVTIRLSDGTDQYGEFGEIEFKSNRGHHGFNEPGVFSALTTLEPIGAHVDDVNRHYHWQVGSTLVGSALTTRQVREHDRTTSAMGLHNRSLFYQSAILDAKTKELLIPDGVTIYYKDWEDERPQPVTDGYRPMARARWRVDKNILGVHYFNLILPEDGESNIVNPELRLKYKAPNGWICQSNGKTGDDHFVHGGYIPAQSEEFSKHLIEMATMPGRSQPVNRGQALPERFEVDGVKMYGGAQRPLLENWPEIPKLG